MGFDLKKNNVAELGEAGYEFELKFPGTFESTGAFVKVRGSESKTVKAFTRKKFEEYQRKVAADKRRGKVNDDISLDEAEELAVESASVRIISWKGIEEDGINVPFTPENAERILTEHSWIRDQVMEASNDLANFR